MISLFARRLMTALVSIALLTGAVPAFANCTAAQGMPAQIAQMDSDCAKMMGLDKQAPVKQKALDCAQACASMASIAFPPVQMSLAAPVLFVEKSWATVSEPDGVSTPPPLPPPILSA
jgi:hypothetical protein